MEQRHNFPAEFDGDPYCTLLERQSVSYYRAAAARAGRLQAEVTTPNLRRFLEDRIAQCERLAAEVERG
jgi:hypothetical protein